MSLLTDSRICPDCRALLDPAGTCTGCDLHLTGPLAAELWTTMQVADSLVERLRVQFSAPVSRGEVAPSRTGGVPAAAPLPGQPARPRRTGLSAASVPAVLFGVGALCLLVAAVVFVAVAWSSLGLGARTSILLGVTATFGALAGRLTLRGLRGAAETFWLVVGALVTIDLTAAYAAGLLGYDHLEGRHAVAVLGIALLGLGVGVGTWVRRTELAGLIAPTLLSTAGALMVAAGEGWAAPSTAAGAAVAVLALAGLAAGTRALDLRHTAYAVSGLAVVSWTVLVGAGLDRAAAVDAAAWWQGLDCWPLLAAVLLAASATFAPIAPALRTVAAAASELAAVLLILGPGASQDTEIVVLAGLAVALAATSALTPRTWSLPAACYAGIAGIVGGGYALVRPLDSLSGLPSTGPRGATGFSQHLTRTVADTSGWTAVVVAVAVVVVGLALLRWIDDPTLGESAQRGLQVAAPTLVALGVVTAFLETGPTVLAAVAAWTGVLVVLAALATVVRGAPAPAVLAGATYLGVVGLRLAVPSHPLAALLATGLAVGLWVGYRRTSADAITQAVTGAAALVAAGFAATHWPYLLGGTGDAAGVTLAVVASVALVGAAWVARPGSRRVLEATALVIGLAGLAFPDDAAIATLVLTIVGSAVALVAVLHTDRDQVAWLGTAILGVAAGLRVSEGLSVPELATAPAAVLLLVAGAHRLLTDRSAGSVRVLGSGLTLALLPTLLLSLDEPVSTRAALLGVAALSALAVGVAQRWAAPFLAGSAVLAALAVRHLGPVADALPRWISLGTVGALLLAVAITWESRRRQLEVAERYLAALR